MITMVCLDYSLIILFEPTDITVTTSLQVEAIAKTGQVELDVVAVFHSATGRS